jgi:transposase
VSGLDELTREELKALVLCMDETVQLQRKEIAELGAAVERQAERIRQLEEEVARLRGGRPHLELSIKPSVPKKEKTPRKKRKHSYNRRSLPPDRVCCHVVENCPECGRKLSGGSVKWRHQVVDIPFAKAEVTDHLLIERCCGVCKKRWTPDPDEVLSGVVVGRKSIGIGLMSIIAHLKTVCRVPVRQIQDLVDTLWQVKISVGEIAELLHDVAETGEPEYEGLLKRIRGSPVLCGDETGWREDGRNGYLWSFSTPEVRYYTYRHSRGKVVVEDVLAGFEGALVTDFYAAYNSYLGVKQRCWVHLLRDLKALVEKNPETAETASWVEKVKDVYERAKAAAKGDYKDQERCLLRRRFESELLSLAGPYIGVKTAPERVLAERMKNFISELFAFVQYPEVPSENNAAERAIRPAVVARKISGGTRSERGSRTTSILRSLFETWRLSGLNPLDACRQMLTNTGSSTSPTT